MPREPRHGVLERHDARQSLERPVSRPLTNRSSIKPSRLLNTASATLAAGVLADSTAEHYRAGFHNRVMFVAPAVSVAALTAAVVSALAPNAGRALPRAVFRLSVLTGLIGFGFHLTNVSRRVGGWKPENVFHGAPVAAPLAITTAGLLGIAAARVARNHPCVDDGSAGSRSLANGRASIPLGSLSALGLLGTSIEASVLHFRGAFQNPFMYAPVVVPPLAAVSLATTVLRRPSNARVARTLLWLTSWLGVVGTGFHAWGVQRRMGGWGNWRQNLMVGPPLPAPPAFTGLALAGLAALELLEAERTG